MKKKSLIKVLALSLMVSAGFTGCAKTPAAAAFKDGSYTGKAEGMKGDIEVSVEVAGGKIAKVNIMSQNETVGVADLALENVPAAIVEKQGTEVDTVAGATVSSEAIIAAVDEALAKAK